MKRLFSLRNKYSVVFSAECRSFREFILLAIKKKISFRDLDLYGSKFVNINFSSIDFSGSNLSGTNFINCNLNGTNFENCDLYCADFSQSDVKNAIFGKRILYHFNVSKQGAIDLAEKIIGLKSTGKIIGYKKIYKLDEVSTKSIICTLEIPAKAKRVGNFYNGKCRAEYAKVLKGSGFSGHDESFFYKEGKIVRPEKKFNNDPLTICASGIHFFLTREQAKNY
jgi:hypothetical protein